MNKRDDSRGKTSRLEGELGETTSLWLVFAMLGVCSCAEDVPAAVTDPAIFFPQEGPALSSGVVVASTERISPAAPMTSVECAGSADEVLSNGIETAVGSVTYAWISAEHAQTIATLGLTLQAKTDLFDERTRLLGSLTQASAIDVVLSHISGALSSWPVFWATRAGDAPADAHLLRLTMRADALWLSERNGEAVLLGPTGSVSPLTNPDDGWSERLAGVFFSSHHAPGSECAAPFASRELVVTNVNMVEHWAIGTEVVVDEVTSGIELFNGFAANARACDFAMPFDMWSQAVACPETSLLSALWLRYAGSLASLDETYYPNVRNLARVSDLIAADLRRWREDPIVAEFQAIPAQTPTQDAGVSVERDAATWPIDAGRCQDAGDASDCITATSLDGSSPAFDAALLLKDARADVGPAALTDSQAKAAAPGVDQ